MIFPKRPEKLWQARYRKRQGSKGTTGENIDKSGVSEGAKGAVQGLSTLELERNSLSLASIALVFGSLLRIPSGVRNR